MRRRSIDGAWLAALTAAWLLFGAVQALLYAGLAAGGLDELLASLGLYETIALYWVVVTLAVVRLRFVLGSRGWSGAARALAHLAFFVIVALLNATLQRTAIALLGGALSVGFIATLLYYADVTLVCYVAAVMLARARDAHGLLVRRERQALALGEQLDRAQLDTLELQLQPHFLFNALGTISELAHEAPERAAAMLRNLGQLLRASVSPGGSDTVTLAEELALLEPYLAIQRVRFADWLTIEQDIEPSVRDALLPRFSLQPIVENAVRHGLSGRAARGRILIRGSADDGVLRVVVEDNGIGLRANGAAGHGAGLRNVRERLTTLYGDDASLTLAERASGGVAVTLAVPLERRASTLDSWSVASATPDAAQLADTDEGGANWMTGASRRWSRSRVSLAAVGAWLLVGAFWAQQSVAYTILRGRLGQIDLLLSVRRDLTTALAWAAATPFVVWLARRLPIARRSPAIILHAVASIACAFAVTTVARLVSPPDGYPLFADAYANYYIGGMVLYWIVLGVTHTRRLATWVHERELASSRLRTALQSARLRKLTTSIRPGLLLDTLEHLERDVVVDPVYADWLVARLGALLRATLETAAYPTTDVDAELRALAAYADVLGAAAAPEFRLVTRLDAHPETAVRAGILRSIIDELMARWDLSGTAAHLTIARAHSGLLVHVLTSGVSSSAPTHEPRPTVLDHLISAKVVTRASVDDAEATFVLAPVEAPIRIHPNDDGGATSARVVKRVKPATALEGR